MKQFCSQPPNHPLCFTNKTDPITQSVHENWNGHSVHKNVLVFANMECVPMGFVVCITNDSGEPHCHNVSRTIIGNSLGPFGYCDNDKFVTLSEDEAPDMCLMATIVLHIRKELIPKDEVTSKNKQSSSSNAAQIPIADSSSQKEMTQNTPNSKSGTTETNPNSKSGTAASPLCLSPVTAPLNIEEVKKNLSNSPLPTKLILPEDHKLLLLSGVSKKVDTQSTLIVFDPPFWFFFKTTDSEKLCALSEDTSCYCNQFRCHLFWNNNFLDEEDIRIQSAIDFLECYFDDDSETIKKALSNCFTLMLHSIDNNTEIQVHALVNFVIFPDFLLIKYLAVEKTKLFSKKVWSNGDDSVFRNRGIATKLLSILCDCMSFLFDMGKSQKFLCCFSARRTTLHCLSKEVSLPVF